MKSLSTKYEIICKQIKSHLFISAISMASAHHDDPARSFKFVWCGNKKRNARYHRCPLYQSGQHVPRAASRWPPHESSRRRTTTRLLPSHATGQRGEHSAVVHTAYMNRRYE